ncbi:hypothetical protein [Candidatus Nitrosocosmicus sp. SS]|uniref:hypothetical protein n=1 Tax=Candidatus Nitrosocosmicus agrestis TaxID=2563600 RepID=UPI00122E1887|nr:hypothetical protein [Candidatus Nitrosocosmicus sp. SS]KAA2282092.1 hypothetical protein F1Z66_06535 [Candidatus Nitrosocosmicus sp. SS]KAF0870063.1 hypothetical protein E5N71_02275 [Candidatus Nitrosocosmicus sp. SS]
MDRDHIARRADLIWGPIAEAKKVKRLFLLHKYNSTDGQIQSICKRGEFGVNLRTLFLMKGM